MNISNKQFREILNETYTKKGLDKGVGSRKGSRIRKYGDYLFSQDREMFNVLKEIYEQTGKLEEQNGN